MANGWAPTPLGAHVDLATGPAFKSAQFRTDPPGIRLARGDNLGEGYFRWADKIRYWPELTHDLEPFLLQVGDVLLGMDGSKVGRNRVRVRRQDLPCLLVQRVARLRARPGLDQHFLYYVISSRHFQNYVSGARTGTSIPHISGPQIRSYRLGLPPLGEQRAIAGLLGALDDKIDLNRRMNETLESLITHQFEHRFGDRAPEEWTQGSIADLARYVNGRNFTKDATGRGRMVIRIAELNSGPGASTVHNDVDTTDDHLARAGDILFAWSGSLGAYRWHGPEALVNQHIFKVVPERFPPWFVFQHIKRAMWFFRDVASDKATTMGHIKRGHLLEAKLRFPPDDDLSAGSSLLEPLDRKMLANHRESRTLAELRDALLPKLISGELRVRDAEAELGSLP